jgi:hypothetical protein
MEQISNQFQYFNGVSRAIAEVDNYGVQYDADH